MAPLIDLVGLVVVAFAGGAIGAAIGGLPAFSLAGLVILVGEVANVARRTLPADAAAPGTLGSTGITASVGLGPGFGPHVAFAGGLAAAAYAARKGYLDTGFDYHEAKNVTYALGTRPDVLVVGGAFGVLGLLLFRASVALALPWDPVAASIVASAFVHRLAFGYPALGDVRGNPLDMSPYERGERRASVTAGGAGRTDGGVEPTDSNGGVESTDPDGGVEPADRTTSERRFVVEPWLPHQYRWPNVALLGAVVGVFAAFTTYATGSPFLAFGLTAASLVFLNLGMERMPVTHHMALPASIAVIGLADATAGGVGGIVPPAVVAESVSLGAVVLVGAAFGLVCGLAGELSQRLLYAHADTHLDPPAAAIVVGTFLVAVLDVAGVLTQEIVPTLGL